MSKKRCKWCEVAPIYVKYHDEEWGIPEYDDGKLFEMLILEGFQTGLSWLTILKRREAFRKAFDDFNIDKILKYDESKIEELLQNENIIRNKLKINSVKINAIAFLKVQDEFSSFANYLWSFVNHKTIYCSENITSSPLSDKISKDLKKRGFKFVGTTIIYAYIQAVGLVNSHSKECFKYINH